MCPWPSSQFHSVCMSLMLSRSLLSKRLFLIRSRTSHCSPLSESSWASRFLPQQQLVLPVSPWISETIGPEDFTALWNSSFGDQGLHLFFPGSFQLSTFSLSASASLCSCPASLLNSSPASFLGGKQLLPCHFWSPGWSLLSCFFLCITGLAHITEVGKKRGWNNNSGLEPLLLFQRT